MTTVNVYLTFNGNCKEAFEFYRSVFGGSITSFNKFSEMPRQNGIPPVSDEMKELIMHITLSINNETVLMGSDTGGEGAPNFQVGNNFSISVNVDSVAEVDRIFSALSDGGKGTMQPDKTFLGSYFCILTDKFDVNWMVSCDLQHS